MDEFTTDTLKERLRERMDAMGKNPSSVAIEAKLSRSAVRDILSGKAKNPGMLTIHAIADVLECSYSYLTGESDKLHLAEPTDILIDVFARTSDISGILEAGVYRQLPPQVEKNVFAHDFGQRERKPLRSEHRYMYRDLYLYKMGDQSLEGLFITKGDLLTAVSDPNADSAPDGALVIVAHRLPGTRVEELSARKVKRRVKGFALSTVPSDWGGPTYPDIEVAERSEQFDRYKTVEGGDVLIEGVVVQLTRQLDM
ncbi:helix-turn-helix domain-containing protein [Allorhizobium sp. NPDC080224]|uniref:helix-turn-helix domain-containing protein n=1 Tax=Allorhizobium sp. NPDC080224 TaxID=3390547 RepID=UPI003D02D306